MKRAVVVTLLALAAGGLSGIAEAQDTSSKKAPEAPKPPRRSRNLITREEIEEAGKGALNAEDLIRRLRPNFLRVPGGQTPGGTAGGPRVYVDNTPLGGTEVLRGIQVDFIGEIAYLDPSEATNRYGTGHQSGAILISSRIAPKR